MNDDESHESVGSVRTELAGAAPEVSAAPTIDEILARTASAPRWEDLWPPMPKGSTLVAECIEDRHPASSGRVKARWTGSCGERHEVWLPMLQGLSVRKGDRLLLSRPENWPEWVVVGVVDGFADRPRPAGVDAARVELRPDEAVVVADRHGRPLLRIRDGEGGPRLELCQPGVALEAEGTLHVKADAITMESSRGPITISSAAHVIVEGEVISLN